MRTRTNVLHSRCALHRQDGAVLIVALLFLVILTMLGVTAMSGTTMEERMSGNSRDMNVALQAAEAALRDARRDINRLPISGVARDMHMSQFGDPGGALGTCNAAARGLCRPLPYVGTVDVAMPATLDVNDPSAARYGEFTGAPPIRATVGGTPNSPLPVAQQPRYLVELFCLPTRGGQDSMGSPGVYCKFYRITARGYGVNPNSQVTLQEMFLSL
jgi:type IV pilus assembly protein PilX